MRTCLENSIWHCKVRYQCGLFNALNINLMVITRHTSRLLSDRRALDINCLVAEQNEVNIRDRFTRSSSLEDPSANIITFNNKSNYNQRIGESKFCFLPETVIASVETVLSKPMVAATYFYTYKSLISPTLIIDFSLLFRRMPHWTRSLNTLTKVQEVCSAEMEYFPGKTFWNL